MSHDAAASALSHTQKPNITEQEGEKKLRLNLGCGRNILEGWVNVDRVKLPGVDVVAELDQTPYCYLDFEDNSVDEFLLSHVLEHIRFTLPLMQELHRIAKPGAKMVIRVPHGASDDAWEDPTHVRPYFPGSFGYFSQPYFWRADYLYRGDWLTEKVELVESDLGKMNEARSWYKIATTRNQIEEIIAHLTAVKPIREPKKELQIAPRIVFL
jgi:SAM-dependent methyltransferase